MTLTHLRPQNLVGQTVQWKKNSNTPDRQMVQGHCKALIPPYDPVTKYLPADALNRDDSSRACDRVKGKLRVGFERFLIEVQSPDGPTLYYTPKISQVTLV